jgi:O-acetylhomoserine (thiol)-lyase
MSQENIQFNTLQLHAGQEVYPTTNSRAVSIYQATASVFNESEQTRKRYLIIEGLL